MGPHCPSYYDPFTSVLMLHNFRILYRTKKRFIKPFNPEPDDRQAHPFQLTLKVLSAMPVTEPIMYVLKKFGSAGNGFPAILPTQASPVGTVKR